MSAEDDGGRQTQDTVAEPPTLRPADDVKLTSGLLTVLLAREDDLMVVASLSRRLAVPQDAAEPQPDEPGSRRTTAKMPSGEVGL
ncbi:hypothetical protein [Streptomyces sp. SudanB66_2053]|uniref:hypothetical protein n=1 Tax=Streptomyces sp. SudanB66_2053 TaxID=3035277 RepID=UPI003F55C129